ncbi:hypothetical protein ACE3NQ_00120 [Paenibacillus terreus]|uniref:Uncharacterized protein n=1 Tax=Paenibacillus terreus TaxID=1387834 RepID=A0ABV5B3Y5_9BACL
MEEILRNDGEWYEIPSSGEYIRRTVGTFSFNKKKVDERGSSSHLIASAIEQ